MSDLLRVNFTFSHAAKAGLEQFRQTLERTSLGDPPALASVGWGYKLDAPPETGNVAVGFYRQLEEADVADRIQEVSGVRFVYFITADHYRRFEGKVLDFSEKHGFFLRDP